MTFFSSFSNRLHVFFCAENLHDPLCKDDTYFFFLKKKKSSVAPAWMTRQ